MKINGNAVRPGMVLEHKGALWRVVRTQATQPGKGGAYNQVEMKNLRDGTKLNERFRAAETIERAYLEQKPYQYLYRDGNLLIVNWDDHYLMKITTNLFIDCPHCGKKIPIRLVSPRKTIPPRTEQKPPSPPII